MRKILIVDDSATNRMLLHALLDEYKTLNSEISLYIKEAKDGKEAVDLYDEHHFDIILMDVMMPRMDGITATQQIKRRNKDVIILAISASTESEHEEGMIAQGAIDYIHKPVDRDLFFAKMKNYLYILASREINEYHNKEAFNLISTNVYRRRIIFMVEAEEDLNQFWQYYIDRSDAYEHIVEATTLVFSVASLYIVKNLQTVITVEESKDNLYFTLRDLDDIPRLLVKRLVRKYATDYLELKEDMDKLTVKISKHGEKLVEAPAVEETTQMNIDDLIIMNPEEMDETTLNVYDFMDDEDMSELKEVMNNLNSLLLLVGSEIDIHEVEEIGQSLRSIAQVMMNYGETYEISGALRDFSETVLEHKEIFQEKSKDLGILCAAFNNDLFQWERMMFHEGAPSVNFLDETIIINVKTIVAMLMGDESEEEDVDDIFDF
jgi:CheY-like chemotaxis protein